MASDPRDKRVHPRFPWVLRVDYPDREQCLDATENLSAGGLFVQTDRTFAIVEEVPLALSFPGLLDEIRIVGRVAWIRPARPEERGGVGIRVESDEDRRQLALLLEPATSPSPPPTPSVAPDGFRILIVEDNPYAVDMYRYVLRRLAAGSLNGKVPLEVEFAADGHEAMGKLQATHFHLVMTDLYMPVMDGFALVERIKADPKLRALPLVVITAAGKEAEQEAMRLGVNIFLRKPVRFAEVLETVKQLLNVG